VSKSLKHIGVLSFLTVVSRILGLVRDMMAASIFGTSLLYSAWVTAFSWPNLFRRLLGEGSMTAAFVPTLQDELHANGRPGAFALLSKVTSWLFVVTGGLVLLAMLALGNARALGGHVDKWYIAADLGVWLFPYMVLVCVAAGFNATLNVMERFTEPALSPIWLNIAMIVSLGGAGLHFAHTALEEIHWLCAGVLVGGAFQAAVPAAVLIHAGWRPRFDLGLSPRVKEIATLMTPGLFGTAIYQINILVSRQLAFSLNDSGATLLFMGNRLMEFPIGVFAIAVSTVVYPLLARHATEGNPLKMAEDFRKGLRLIVTINIPAAVGLALLSRPIVRLLYEHGRFNAADASNLANVVMLFSIGMPFFSVVNLTVRAFYAVKDIATPVRVAAIDFCINIVISLSLMRWLGVPGLVMASTTAIIAQTLLLHRALVRRMPAMRFAPLWPSVAKVFGGTAVMAGVVCAGWFALKGMAFGPRATDATAVAGLIPLGMAAYGLAIWLLRIEGREELAAVLVRVPVLGRLFRPAL
jgi:putative peptidoglycan lipid II flippase